MVMAGGDGLAYQEKGSHKVLRFPAASPSGFLCDN